jgi:hypothetical protein
VKVEKLPEFRILLAKLYKFCFEFRKKDKRLESKQNTRTSR